MISALTLSLLIGLGHLLSPGGSIAYTAEARLRTDVVVAHRAACGNTLSHGSRRLTALARYRSADMLRHDYFSHADRRGEHTGDRLRRWHLAYRYAGEDIVWNMGLPSSTSSADVAFWQLMWSASHRALIRDCHYTELAIGAVHLGAKTMFTLLFRRR
jgi:hypothetical protein